MAKFLRRKGALTFQAGKLNISIANIDMWTINTNKKFSYFIIAIYKYALCIKVKRELPDKKLYRTVTE